MKLNIELEYDHLTSMNKRQGSPSYGKIKLETLKIVVNICMQEIKKIYGTLKMDAQII